MATHPTATTAVAKREMAKSLSLDDFTEAEILALAYDWKTFRRDKQAEPPGDWLIWLILTGRGWGKNRTGGETIRHWVESGKCKRLVLVARTAGDVRKVMVEGDGGILDISPPWFMPIYEPAKCQLTWPNGAIALLFGAEKPDALRGPQCDGWWADEIATWQYLDAAWDNIQFGARLGNDVRGIVTTTPRPIKQIKELIENPHCHVTRGNTFENAANLAPGAIAILKEKYEGTRIGRQELNAEILEDNPLALWKRGDIEKHRVKEAPDMPMIIVGVDPAVSATEDSAETGIIIAGKDGQNPPHYYILGDRTQNMASPNKWGRAAVEAYKDFSADKIVPEANQGGDMVVNTIRTIDSRVPIKKVHASRGKRTRAEPVASLSEQGRLHHVGCFPELEDQMCEWVPPELEASSDGTSRPKQKACDRMDAAVWAVTELQGSKPHIRPFSRKMLGV